MKKEYKLQNGQTVVFKYDENGIGKITVEAMDCLIDMLPKWIPCDERLPEEYVQVLCYQPKVIADEMWIGYINEKGIWVKGSGWEQYTNPVTAWMPLPSPYREETES